MDTLECIKARASVRKFTTEPIKDRDLETILEAAGHAPSAHNTQDWEFVVVKKGNRKQALAEACRGQKMIEQSPVSIVVCANLKKADRMGSRGRELYTFQDTAAATMNMLLSAWNLEIGSCWVGAFDEGKVRQLLVLPEHVRPVAVVVLGYPAEKPSKPERWPIEDFVHEETFSE